MSALLATALILLGVIAIAQLALSAVTVYRLLAKRVIDPLGHDSRLQVLDRRVLALEMRQADLIRSQAETERKLFDRLDEMRDTQSKMLGQMTAFGSRVDAEVRERQEVTSRLDQITAAVSNVASRFGGIETALKQVLNATPAEVKP